MKLNLNDDAGFTLLEALISLMVSSMVLLLLAAGIIHIDTINNHFASDADSLTDLSQVIYEDRQIEWHSFLNQLAYNLDNSKNPIVRSHAFSLDEWDREEHQYYTVRYDRSSVERRSFLRYKNNGNTRMLSNVYLPTFKQEGGWLILDFSFRNGESHRGRMWLDNWTEKDAEN